VKIYLDQISYYLPQNLQCTDFKQNYFKTEDIADRYFTQDFIELRVEVSETKSYVVVFG